MNMNRAGFSFAEALMTLAVLSIVTMALMSAATTLFRVQGDTGRILDSNRMMISLMESIRSDPSLFQANFAPPTVEDSSILDPAQMPLAYRNGFFGPADQCPDCKVKLGFIIRPIEGNPGLFRITVRSATWNDDGAVTTKDMYGISTSN